MEGLSRQHVCAPLLARRARADAVVDGTTLANLDILVTFISTRIFKPCFSHGFHMRTIIAHHNFGYRIHKGRQSWGIKNPIFLSMWLVSLALLLLSWVLLARCLRIRRRQRCLNIRITITRRNNQ